MVSITMVQERRKQYPRYKKKTIINNRCAFEVPLCRKEKKKQLRNRPWWFRPRFEKRSDLIGPFCTLKRSDLIAPQPRSRQGSRQGSRQAHTRVKRITSFSLHTAYVHKTDTHAPNEGRSEASVAATKACRCRRLTSAARGANICRALWASCV